MRVRGCGVFEYRKLVGRFDHVMVLGWYEQIEMARN